MLAAIECSINSLIYANRESSTNILYLVLFKSLTPVWIASFTAWTNFVPASGCLENWTLSMICLYFSNRSLLSDKWCARWTLALAIGSKFGGLVIEPKVPPNGINKKFSIMKEKAAATSGWYLQWRNAPLTSSSNSRMSECG